MADYMLMVLEDEAMHAAESPKNVAELIDGRTRFADELRRGGKLRDGGRLRPSKEGKRVCRDGEQLQVHDGPFAEEGKALGAFYLVDAAGVDEAARIGSACPALSSDEID